MHWLANVALKAGLASPENLGTIAAGTPLTDAWRAVARYSGRSEAVLAQAIAQQLRLQNADVAQIEPRVLKLIPEKIARRFTIIPLHEDDRTLVVASADPFNLDAEQAIAFASGRTPIISVADPFTILRAIDDRYSPEKSVGDLISRAGPDVSGVIAVEEHQQQTAVDMAGLEAGPVVKLTNLVFADAIRQEASDIHIEPQGRDGVVRFRVDGVLRPYVTMPMPALTRVVSRVKVMAKLDIADHLRPQDGRARVFVDGKYFDLRVSTVPARNAEKAVIRILHAELGRTLDESGLGPSELTRIRALLCNREGIVLITGPTGSGKTTTIYAALQELLTGETNISTVEDPVEYELPGITQIQVEEKQGVTFAGALRALLRQDPDIIFVGEIRDDETAQIAVQAAMTGHLVLATVHTNDAMSVVPRLVDLDVDRSAIAATLRGALAQRLVRRLCTDCATETGDVLSEEERRLSDKFGVRPKLRPQGCTSCGQSGYRGRIPVAEVAVIDSALAQSINDGASVMDLQRSAIASGMKTLLESARRLVANGVTSLAELERVVGDSELQASGTASPDGTQTANGAVRDESSVPVPPVSATPTERPSTYVRAMADEPPPPDDRPHVVLVDDDATQRHVARGLLEQYGYRVSENLNGTDALARLQSGERVDLVVLDLDMPQMNGREFLRRARSGGVGSNVPIIVLTGTEGESAEAELMDEGANDYIIKPLDPPRFIARVRAALRRVVLT